MGLRTITLPSGRQYTYDDSNIPKQPTTKDALMAQLGPLGALLGYKLLAGSPMAEKTGGLLGYLGDAIKGGGSTAAASGGGLLGSSASLTEGLGNSGLSGLESAATQGLDASTLGADAASQFGLDVGGAGAAASNVGFFGGNGLLGEGAMGAGQYIPGLLGAYGMYDMLSNQNRSKGLSALEGAAAGAGIGTTLSPGIGTALGAVIGGLGGLISGGHKSTKERTNDRFDELLAKSQDPNYQTFVNVGKTGSLSGGDTWTPGDSRESAPMNTLAHSYGAINAFGPEWATLSDEQRQAIMQKVLDANLLKAKQGDYLIDDVTAARKLRDEYLAANRI